MDKIISENNKKLGRYEMQTKNTINMFSEMVIEDTDIDLPEMV